MLHKTLSLQKRNYSPLSAQLPLFSNTRHQTHHSNNSTKGYEAENCILLETTVPYSNTNTSKVELSAVLVQQRHQFLPLFSVFVVSNC